MSNNQNPVINYYRSFESLLGYRYLRGVKHFGYYPEGQEHLSMYDAQILMNEQLAKRLSLPADSKVLDAGCGEGGVAIYLAEKYHINVDGIDLLDFNIKRAYLTTQRKRLATEVSFQVGSYMELPFVDSTFDAVYTMETLVHAPDYKKALSEFYRVLKPGGKIVLFEYSLKPEHSLTVQEKHGMKKIRQVNRVAAMPAFNEFDFDNMQSLIEQAGYRDVSVTDITLRILPLLKSFADKARLPYNIARLFHFENHIINAMSAVVFWDNRRLMHYNIIEAEKPSGTRTQNNRGEISIKSSKNRF